MGLQELSQELSALVEATSASVVRVEGRRRTPSSGAVWSEDGVVVATHHAVDGDEGVPVGLADGRVAEAAVVGRDPGSDLVVLRTGVSGLAPARWTATDTARTGQLIVGLSRPGRAVRAQLGILSATVGGWRAPSGSRFERYLESSIGLQPGFSGGVLLGPGGAALGLNAAGLLRGTSLAVPAETVRRVVEALLAGRGPRRGFLGVGTQPIALTPDLRARLGQPQALLVLSVQPDTPAARAGLLLGDVLLKAGGDSLSHPAALLPHLDEEQVGRSLALEVLRAGEVLSVTVVVGERGAS